MQRYENLSKEDLTRLLGEAESVLKADRTADDAQRLLHDLQLHQIELEIQNRDLRSAQAELEASRHRYAELYDFAPVGYLSLDPNGVIRSLNLTAAKLLGGERARVLGKPLVAYMPNGDSTRLFAHLRATFAGQESTTCEIALKTSRNGDVIQARLDSRSHKDPDGALRCLTTLTDISETRRLEAQLRESHQEVSTLLATAPVGIGVVQHRRFKSLSPRFLEMLGYQETELLGQSSRKVYASDAEFERVGREKYAQIARGGIGELETVMRRRDGALIDVLLRSASLDVGDPNAPTIFTVLDITGRKQTEQSLVEARRILELALEGGDIGTYSVEVPSGEGDFDLRYLGMLGYLPGELKLDWASWLSMIHPDDRARVDARAAPVLAGELDSFEAEYRMRHRLGHWVWVLDRARVFERDARAGTLRTAGTHIDVTRRREAERKLEHLVEHDELTGVLNRRGLWISVERVHAHSTRAMRPYCLAMLDLDHFKQVNDAYGHPVGDEVLREVTVRLREGLRQADYIGRWGGEEFVVALPETTVAQALETIERLRKAIAAIPIPTEAGPLKVTLSAGLVGSISGEEPERLIAAADAALYRAKAAGRNCTVFEGGEDARRSISIAVLVQDALRTAGIQAAFQPIVQLRGRQPVGEEVLARIVNDELGTMPAASFLEVAQQLGLMHKIDSMLLHSVIAQLQPKGASISDPKLLHFVNLSGDLLRHRDTVIALADKLRALSIALERPPPIVLTITEQQVAAGADFVAEALAPMLESGCKLAVGRCGSETTCFRFLSRLPIDFVELDLTLVRQARESPRALTVLSSIQKAAHDLGQLTLAKQIEDESTLHWLIDFGVDLGQGYLFGAPSDPGTDPH